MTEETFPEAVSSREWRIVINRVYDHFHNTGTWPTFGQLDRPLYREEQFDLVKILRSMPNTYVLFDGGMNVPACDSKIQLRIKAIATCVGSGHDLHLYFEALRWFAYQESQLPDSSADSECVVTRQELLNYLSATEYGSSWTNAAKVASLVLLEPGWIRSTFSQNADGEWSLAITRYIRYFKSIRDLNDYNDAVARLMHDLNPPNSFQGLPSENLELVSDSTENDAPPSLTIIDVEVSSDRYIFIVMPFNEPWSNASHSFIKSAIARVPSAPPLRPLRADDITKRGDITEQIIEAIEGAALVISDVTSTKLRRGWLGRRHYIPNANVMWELGYSMARETLGHAPNVIINQNPKYAPFDVSHLRQMQYSVQTNDTEIERLAKVIADNLPLPLG